MWTSHSNHIISFIQDTTVQKMKRKLLKNTSQSRKMNSTIVLNEKSTFRIAHFRSWASGIIFFFFMIMINDEHQHTDSVVMFFENNSFLLISEHNFHFHTCMCGRGCDFNLVWVNLMSAIVDTWIFTNHRTYLQLCRFSHLVSQYDNIQYPLHFSNLFTGIYNT